LGGVVPILVLFNTATTRPKKKKRKGKKKKKKEREKRVETVKRVIFVPLSHHAFPASRGPALRKGRRGRGGGGKKKRKRKSINTF